MWSDTVRYIKKRCPYRRNAHGLHRALRYGFDAKHLPSSVCDWEVNPTDDRHWAATTERPIGPANRVVWMKLINLQLSITRKGKRTTFASKCLAKCWQKKLQKGSKKSSPFIEFDAKFAAKKIDFEQPLIELRPKWTPPSRNNGAAKKENNCCFINRPRTIG